MTHLTAPLAGGTGGGGSTRFGTGAFAARTLLIAGELYLLFDAEDGFLEFESQVVLEIAAAARGIALAGRTTPKAKTKEFLEDVA